MNAPQPGPNLTAALNEARANLGDLHAVLDQAVHDTVESLFVESVRDEALHSWHAEHAGNSLVARLGSDGTVASCVEMPTAEAAAIANDDPDHTLIVATWPGGAQ